MRKTLFASLLTLVGLVPVLQVQAGGLIICHDIRILPHPVPPRPIPPRPHPVFAPLELRTQKVDVKIENQVARTTVEQVFYNPNSFSNLSIQSPLPLMRKVASELGPNTSIRRYVN